MPFFKHVFKYGEYRTTQYLNTMSKDDYGRHRGVVLYGMKLIPNSTNVLVDSGALYTPMGTKIFWDAKAQSVDEAFGRVRLDNLMYQGFSVLNSNNNAARPLVIGIVAELPEDLETLSASEPKIETEDDVKSSVSVPPIKFSAVLMSYRRDSGRPGFNLFPHHPITMAASDVSGWSGGGEGTLPTNGASDAGFSGKALETAAAGTNDIRSFSGGSPYNAALQVNQILLGYIVLGGTSSTTSQDLGTGTWAPGVLYVPCINPWQSLADLIGTDPLMGRATGVDGGVADALDNSNGALAQVAAGRKSAAAGSGDIPLLVPRFGTPAVNALGYNTAWDNYRFPNFFRDGDQILESLRRLDYVLRLWMDKTGDQGIVRSVQDGVLNGPTTLLSRFAPLEQILYQMGGTTAGNNLNVAKWASDQDLPNPGNYVTSAALGSGGSGYTANDILTLVGGTGTAATIKVLTVSTGVVVTFQVLSGGSYTVNPSGTCSTTGGTGTGATFTPTMGTGDAWEATVATLDADTILGHVLKSGVITHIPQASIDVTTMGSAGDSTRQAIRALDWAIFHTLNDVIGITPKRSYLRYPGVWVGASGIPAWIDLPTGFPVNNTGKTGVQSSYPKRPTLTVDPSAGTASQYNVYLGTESMSAAITAIVARTSKAGSPNLLKNPVFAKQGALVNGGGFSPTDWTIDGTSTWTITSNRMVGQLATRLYQYVDVGGNLPLLGSILDTGILGLSISMANMTSSNAPIKVSLRITSGSATPSGTTLVEASGYLIRTGTTESTGYTNYAFMVGLPASRDADTGAATAYRTAMLAAIKGIGIEIVNPDGAGAMKDFSIAGAWLGVGAPPSVPMCSQEFHEFLSRDGGTRSAMRGDLEMGGKNINNALNVNATNNVNASNDVAAGRDVTATRNVSATADVSAGGTLIGAQLRAGGASAPNFIVDAAGNATATGTATFGSAGTPSVVTVHRDPINPTDAVNLRYLNAHLHPTYAYLASKKSSAPYASPWTMYLYSAPTGEQLCGIETDITGMSNISTTVIHGRNFNANFVCIGEWGDPVVSMNLLAARIVSDSVLQLRATLWWEGNDNYVSFDSALFDAVPIDGVARQFIVTTSHGGSDGSVIGMGVKAVLSTITAPDSTTVKEVALTFSATGGNGPVNPYFGGYGLLPNNQPLLGYASGGGLTLSNSIQHVRRYYV